MKNSIRNNKNAFTLVEIMIVVAIIGLLAALAIPGFVKARKQSQGRRAVSDARIIDAAVTQWAQETGQTDGAFINWNVANSYMKNPNQYTYDGINALGFDPVNNYYRLGTVGSTQVLIAAETKSSLQGVGIDWGSY